MGELSKANLRAWVVGKSGYGKSHFIKHTLLPLWDRVLVVDPMAEYGPHVETVVTTPAAAHRWLVERGAGHHLAPFRLACVPDTKADYLAYLRLAYLLPSSLVVAEEVDEVSEPSYAPPELKRLAQRGRHRRISSVCATQRPAATPIQLRAQAELLVAFRLTTPQDLDALKFAFGDGAASIRDLGVGEYRFSGNPAVIRTYGLALPLDKRLEP